MVDPGWTRYLVATAEPFDRGSTERRPTESVDARLLWEGEWIGDELSTLLLGIVIPLVHEIAQRYPRTFALTDGLIGHGNGLLAITCVHSDFRLSLIAAYAILFSLYHTPQKPRHNLLALPNF